ncbi:RNA-binding domain-containing protein [Bacteroides congonensis]
MEYDKNTTYNLKVTGTLTIADSQYYLIEDNQLKLRVKMLQSQYGLPIPETIRCTLSAYDADGSPLFVQEKTDITIDEPDNRQLKQETNFLTYSQLIQNIRTEPPLESLTLDALKERTPINKKPMQMLVEYEKGVGTWILSYLAVLQSEMDAAIEVKNTKLLCALVHYQQAIIEWMLEDSLYLTLYSPDVTDSYRKECERKLARGEALVNAVTLMQGGEADAFLQKTFSKIRTSGYLLDKSRKIAQVIALFSIDTTLWNKNPGALAEFCRYLATGKTDEDEYSLLTLIDLIRKYIDNPEWDETRYDRAIHLLALYLLLCKSRENMQFSVYKAMLYRYCCTANPESARFFIDKAFNELVTEENTCKLEFAWNDVIRFKTEFFVTKLRVFTSDTVSEEQQSTAQLAVPNGHFSLRNSVFSIYVGKSPNTLMDYQKNTEILSPFERRIQIIAGKELKPKMTEKGNITVLKRCWEELTEISKKKVNVKPNKETTIKTLPTVGTQVTIRLSAFNPRFPLMMFAEIDDPDYEGKGALLANEVCHYRINSFSNIFYEGDTFDATVVKVDSDGRLSFSIFQELSDMAISTVQPDSRFYAKLYRVQKKSCMWLSKEGYCLFTPATYPYPEVGETAILKVRNINKQRGYINAAVLEYLDAPIDTENALAALVREYIGYCQPDDDSECDEKDWEMASDEELANTKKQLELPLLRELSRLLIASAALGSSVAERYNILGSALLTACFTNDEICKEYATARMSYEENIYSFATHPGQTHWEDNLKINDGDIVRFPSLAPLRERIQILKQFYSHAFDPHLAVGIATTKDKNKEHIIRLVLANSLLHQTLEPDELLFIRNELLRRIGAAEFVVTARIEKKEEVEEKIEVINLGRESGEVEFKTSIVYPVNRSLPDMKQQSEVILRTIAGFLNANGGTLYIGVADNGNVTGLANDYSYMVCNSDAYERFIRQRIISTMGKDINGIIHIDFPKYGGREICHVTIPCYGKLVELNEAVWQRQGNSTVLLDGNALLKQQQRKKDTLKNELKALESERIKISESDVENEELISQSLQDTGTIQTSVAAAFAASLKKKMKKEKEQQPTKKRYKIPTSSLRAVSQESYIATYLTLLENGGYMLTDEIPHIDNAILTLAINESEADGSLLLCYDNAYVNRVPLRILLQKKRDYAYKNGVNKDMRLIFATIENGEPYILCCTNKQGNDYFKLVTIEKIKQNTDLTLKGTPLFSYDFGEVTRWEVIPETEADKLKKLVCDKLQYQGVAIHAETITAEREVLETLGIRYS